MPQGLQVWDADGSVKLDTSTLLGRIVGSINVPQGQSSGVINSSEFSKGRPFLVSVFGLGDFTDAGFNAVGPAYSQVSYSYTSTSITWNRTTNARESTLPAGIIYYGVF